VIERRSIVRALSFFGRMAGLLLGSASLFELRDSTHF
jgi:hypothetical protein